MYSQGLCWIGMIGLFWLNWEEFPLVGMIFVDEYYGLTILVDAFDVLLS